MYNRACVGPSYHHFWPIFVKMLHRVMKALGQHAATGDSHHKVGEILHETQKILNFRISRILGGIAPKLAATDDVAKPQKRESGKN